MYNAQHALCTEPYRDPNTDLPPEGGVGVILPQQLPLGLDELGCHIIISGGCGVGGGVGVGGGGGGGGLCWVGVVWAEFLSVSIVALCNGARLLIFYLTEKCMRFYIIIFLFLSCFTTI